jgi:hypothetical protein
MSTDVWTHILTCIGYTGDGEVTITAERIKACKSSWNGEKNQFEPRLLTYQTSANSRPEIFKRYNISILPIKNGTYILTKAVIYKNLDYTPTDIVPITRDASSLILRMGDSETSLIDNLRYSGVFERPEILGEPITHGPLLNGRHRCSLSMDLGTSRFNIEGVQYETDSCYESEHKVLAIEGKSSKHEIDSFNIRQLFFPYREISKIATSKQVICAFIHMYRNKVHIWKYSFPEPNRMDSIQLDGHYMYTFNS